jgi:hypothetical protein
LNKRGADWAAVLGGRIVDDDLLNFDKIGNKPIGVDTSLVVSGTCMMPASSCNNDNVEN